MMPAMEATAMKVLDGTAVRSPTQLQDAYELFRLERQGNLVTPRTPSSTTYASASSSLGWDGRRQVSTASPTST